MLLQISFKIFSSWAFVTESEEFENAWCQMAKSTFFPFDPSAPVFSQSCDSSIEFT